MKEVWKDIPNFEGYYQVSSTGKVRSLERKFVNKRNQHRTYPSKILKPTVMPNGYLQVNLKKQGKTFRRFVHRLVATVFVPNEFGYKTVNHIDENKQNNCISNLEWCSQRYNNNYGTRLKRAIQSRSKRIALIDKDGDVIATFKNSIVAGTLLKIDSRLIRGVAEGSHRTAGGYMWKYLKKGE